MRTYSKQKSSPSVPYIKKLESNLQNTLPEEFRVTAYTVVRAFLKMIQIISTERLEIQ